MVFHLCQPNFVSHPELTGSPVCSLIFLCFLNALSIVIKFLSLSFDFNVSFLDCAVDNLNIFL